MSILKIQEDHFQVNFLFSVHLQLAVKKLNGKEELLQLEGQFHSQSLELNILEHTKKKVMKMIIDKKQTEIDNLIGQLLAKQN